MHSPTRNQRLSLSNLSSSRGNQQGMNIINATESMQTGAMGQEQSTLARLPPRPFPNIVHIADDNAPYSPPKSKYVSHHQALTQSEEKSTPYLPSRGAGLQREQEVLLKSSIDLSKQQMIEQLQCKIIELEDRLVSQRDQYEESALATERQFQQIMQEKELRHKELAERYERDMQLNRQQLHEKDKHYVQLISDQESKQKEAVENLKRDFQEQLQSIQAKVTQDQEWRSIAEQARLEAKGDDVKKEYEKRLKKMEKLVQQTMDKYHEKDLQIQGALEESRREIISLKEVMEKRERAFQEHMSFQDKKVLQYQRCKDDYDTIINVAETWRCSANDLASYVIRTAATVGELPYDFLAKMDNPERPNEETHTFDLYKGEYVQYTKTHHVAVSKSLLTRALRLSKLIHERVKAEIVPSK